MDCSLTVASLFPLQAEAGRAQLELSMTKLRAEEASLRDSLSKLSALNESLAQDKLELNRLIAQVDCAPAPHVLYQETAQRHARALSLLSALLSTAHPDCPSLFLACKY